MGSFYSESLSFYNIAKKIQTWEPGMCFSPTPTLCGGQGRTQEDQAGWALPLERNPGPGTACTFTYWQLKAKSQFTSNRKILCEALSCIENPAAHCHQAAHPILLKICWIIARKTGQIFRFLLHGKFWCLVLFWFGMNPVILKLPTKEKFIGKKNRNRKQWRMVFPK